MTPYANAPGRVVIKTSRETLVLCAAATAMAFALSYSVHTRPGAPTPPVALTQDWTGHLPSVEPAPAPEAKPERITSASLVMPKEQLALPRLDLRPLAKLRFCDDGICDRSDGGQLDRADVPLPQPRRDGVGRAAQKIGVKREATDSNPGLLSRLNPLRQIPEVPGLLKKPFLYAGDTVTGWFKRF